MDERHDNLGLSLNKHASLSESHRNQDTNKKPKVGATTIHCAHNEFRLCGSNYFGLGPRRSSERLKGEHYVRIIPGLPSARLCVFSFPFKSSVLCAA